MRSSRCPMSKTNVMTTPNSTVSSALSGGGWSPSLWNIVPIPLGRCSGSSRPGMRPPGNNEPMNKQSDKSEALDALEAIAERAERGEDVSGHFTNRHVAKQRVNIDFPLELLRQID